MYVYTFRVTYTNKETEEFEVIADEDYDASFKLTKVLVSLNKLHLVRSESIELISKVKLEE